MQNKNIKTAAVITEYIKKTLKFNDSEVLQINIKYPEIKIIADNKTEKKINDFYSSAIQNFINYCEKILYKNAALEFSKRKKAGEEFRPFGAVVTFETTYNKHDFLCVCLDINIYAGKGRGNAVRKAHIWSCKGGELVRPEKFIKFTRPTKNKICEYIHETMINQIKNGEENYIKSDLRSVYKNLNMKNFELSETGYSFFFPQDTVAPFESGIVSFAVPEKILS